MSAKGLLTAKDQSIVYILDDDPDVRDGLATLLQSVQLKTILLGSTRAFLAQKRSECRVALYWMFGCLD
jgi:FixJ family two-component response regulator